MFTAGRGTEGSRALLLGARTLAGGPGGPRRGTGRCDVCAWLPAGCVGLAALIYRSISAADLDAAAVAAAAAAAAAGSREAELRADAGADLDNHVL